MIPSTVQEKKKNTERFIDRIIENDPPLSSNLNTTKIKQDTNEFKVKGWENILKANSNQKKVGIHKLISDFKPK